jgi:hypothetical protein
VRRLSTRSGLKSSTEAVALPSALSALPPADPLSPPSTIHSYPSGLSTHRTMSALLNNWSAWTPPASGHMVHKEDQPAIGALPTGKIAPQRTWSQYVSAPDFGRDDKQLQLQLLPIPFLGNVANAKVIILLQNPGLAPSDYFAELERKDFRGRLEANLRGDLHEHEFPFLFLDPDLAWHAGFTWWHRKLQPVIAAVAEKLESKGRPTTLRAARQALARHVAAIELLPYHSKTGVLSSSQIGRFASVTWAREHVRDVLSSAKIDVIAMRQIRLWDPQNEFAKSPRWCGYASSQSMAATLKPGHVNGGGNRIVQAVVNAVLADG